MLGCLTACLHIDSLPACFCCISALSCPNLFATSDIFSMLGVLSPPHTHTHSHTCEEKVHSRRSIDNEVKSRQIISGIGAHHPLHCLNPLCHDFLLLLHLLYILPELCIFMAAALQCLVLLVGQFQDLNQCFVRSLRSNRVTGSWNSVVA